MTDDWETVERGLDERSGWTCDINKALGRLKARMEKLEDAYAQGRREALEEAALVATSHEVECPRFCCSCATARAIRALIQDPQGES